MLAVLERIDLARTILAQQRPETGDAVTLPEELLADEPDNERTDEFDPVAEGLGLWDDESNEPSIRE